QVTVVPLVGGVGDTRVDIHANQVAAKMASQLGAEYKLLHAPVVVDSVEAKESLLSQPAIAEVFETARRARVALLGVGGTPENSTMRVCYFGDHDFLDMQASGVVGDICSQFYDRECNFDRFPWNSRVVALGVDQLKEIPVVIGVASGEHKIQALYAALRGGLIDVLVTDHVTAQGIMEINWMQ
ncbi:MAG: sugar-binding domain-containing protein, partial [Kyrpidia sp.]|nr:sugar-binding domain-containing protein [Kyrpidia sp.]